MEDYFEVFIPLMIALSTISIVSMWRIYLKAGMPGWAVLVPIYNLVVLLKIVKKPVWWFFLLLIPLVNIVFAVWITNLLSKSFGKDEGFAAGLLLLSFVFYPILAFGSPTYIYEEKNDRYDDMSEKARSFIIMISLAVLFLGPIINMLFTQGGILGYDDFMTWAAINAVYHNLTIITPFLFGISINIKYRHIGIVLGACLVIVNSLGYIVIPSILRMSGV